MSSSDEGTVPKKNQAKTSKKAAKTDNSSTPNAEYQIKPAKGGPSMDTSTWPLLLKVRACHTIPFIISSGYDILTSHSFWQNHEGSIKQ